MKFPADFVWGSATASYQIEGSRSCEGLSVWDMMCRHPGKVFCDHNGLVACDHYNRYKEDIGIMAELGLKHYRLSFSWPRVMPEGIGKISEKGMDFYDRLIDELLEKGITPWVTLFHWDYPYELFLKGGWLNRDSADWFAEYTLNITKRFSDRVSNWMTMNEPHCFIGLGHLSGTQAPGLQLGISEVLVAAHNTMRAHGKAVKVLRQNARSRSNIGWVVVSCSKVPVDETPENVEAARDAFFAIRDTNHLWNNTWFTDPLFFGKYPEDGVKLFGDAMPEILDGDMETISEPIDFLGLNAYAGAYINAQNRHGGCEPMPVGAPQTTMGWYFTPEILYWSPKFFADRYNIPIYITENGMANIDLVSLDGMVHDPQRIDYLHRYLRYVGRAVEEGIDLQGYFQWSFLDNFEWAKGYGPRFGLVHVDYATQKRIVKDSARWYSQVVKSNGANL